jgi:hypothetical protein
MVSCFIQKKDNFAIRHLVLQQLNAGGWNGGDGQFI